MARRFSLTELETLALAAEGLTLSEIGRRLGLSHSSVSKTLRRMQQRAGLQLVERRGRRVHLTVVGRELARTAQKAVVEAQELAELVTRLQDGTQGVLRILASPTAADVALPPIMSEFLQTFPRVRVHLRVVTMFDMEQSLASGEYDLAVGAPVSLPPGWRSETLYEDELLFVASPRSRFACSATATWDEIRSVPLAGHFDEPGWSHLWVRLTGRPFDPRFPVELRTIEAIKRFVETGGGTGILARSSIAQEIDRGDLVPLRVGDISLRIPYVLHYNASSRPLQVVEEFRDLLLQRLRTAG